MSLTADTENLWRAGAVNLPRAAVDFADAAAQVHNTGAISGDAFGDSPVGAKWVALRNALQDDVLVVTSNRLIRAGDALQTIAVHYSRQDAQASQNLDDLRRNIDQEDPDNQPPLAVPIAPRTTDPHPQGPNR